MHVDDIPVPFSAFVAKYEWPSMAALRNYRYKAKEMGIEKAFVKIGKRVLIKPRTFFELIQKVKS